MTARQAYAPFIRLENVAINRGNRRVLSGMMLDANAGDLIWVRGANGCGKSTLLRTIAGLLDITSGRAEVEGRVALSDENLALEPNMTVGHALKFWADLDGGTPADCDSALSEMDLLSLCDVPVRYLSTGQKKRAGLARVLSSNAAIWLLDEPYNGLDSASSAHLDRAILRHLAAGGLTLLAAHQSPSINITQSLLLDSSGQMA
ncbi:heme ABC exporter ATP-binding protein CcmA [Sphingorhabdus sp. IMCC26285]|uniref:Heme ABC exporter ATP-binding protein CcmA n=1 Tax=Sphingorhabdus profundilacus TaxID=2509718 RepID=A0A6I4LVJ3_9SPHN|nr:heme ABC exporter ATP-binding protein CcmA [Sphingorhabdus profundilacus]MVZ97051.1 heme ABC exporter ATP-binding protein CcmA [Sphingorhabdus profundilacus]